MPTRRGGLPREAVAAEAAVELTEAHRSRNRPGGKEGMRVPGIGGLEGWIKQVKQLEQRADGQFNLKPVELGAED